MADPYSGREQTEAKHFILKHYLEELAFKVLNYYDITYVDGFSGPWQSKTEDFSDSSFMIAISVLLDAQKKIFERTGIRRRIRCFFSENNPDSFSLLHAAVAPYHRPDDGFEIETFSGEFVNAVPNIQHFIGGSFPLIFIDPTGWTGYPLDKIKPLFQRQKCEVLINFMYEFINRFANCEDEKIIESMSPILGGSGWRNRLDHNLSSGLAVEKLFRETLKTTGNFSFVVSTKIEKATMKRTHFCITYATKSSNGLIAFRDIEYKALKAHAGNRANAMEKKREDVKRMSDLFAGHDAIVQEASIDEIVEQQKQLAAKELIAVLPQDGGLKFSAVVDRLLEAFMLRKNNVKDICVALAKSGEIENTWGTGNKKPQDDDIIRLCAPHRE